MIAPVPPRGIRNCNPGDIKFNEATAEYPGCIGSDGEYCIFDTAEHGIQAIARLLLVYKRKHKIASIRSAITRWTATDREAYIRNVSAALRVGDTAVLNFADPKVLVALVRAIIKQECGTQPYSAIQIYAGVAPELHMTTGSLGKLINGRAA